MGLRPWSAIAVMAWLSRSLKKTGMPIIVLSTEANPVVQKRADKLDIPCIQGQTDKGTALQQWLEELRSTRRVVVYLGNDYNDIPCMQLVGCPAAVTDAKPEILPFARLVLEHPGGQGAIREICNLILKRKPHA